MQYHTLADTDLKISKICLGTMTFGQQNTEGEAHQQLDYAVANGVNFIDTAEMYSIPPRAETYGKTEEYIGNWLAKNGKRGQLIIASKVIGQADWMPHVRNGQACLDRKNIMQAIEGSLKRLQTDYIDLYQVHWPDRKTNFFGKLGYQHDETLPPTTILETLEALSALVTSGKVRYIGVSNETPWGVMQYLMHSQFKQLARIVSIQNPYSLLNRSFEVGLSEISHQENIPLLAYSPLGFGVLSGKYLKQIPKNSRLDLFPDYKRYSNEKGIAATRAYVELAEKNNLSASQMALAFVNSRPFVGANIIGATTMTQLQENISSINIKLSNEVLEEIETIHRKYSNPCP